MSDLVLFLFYLMIVIFYHNYLKNIIYDCINYYTMSLINRHSLYIYIYIYIYLPHNHK